MIDQEEQPVDCDFVRLMPKVELHAHLSGSINKATLHKLWRVKQAHNQCLDLSDPLVALQDMPDVFTFFKIFDQYIYKLINDKQSLRTAVDSVINDFVADGVAYLELRTTPRNIPEADMNRQTYVETVLEAIRDHPSNQLSRIEVHLLLSIDRKMSYEDAAEVLELAEAYSSRSAWYEQQSQHHPCPAVVGIDLCGNPLKGDVSTFTKHFLKAKALGLHTTVHYAEVPESSSRSELETILSWHPDRLGHVIHVPKDIRSRIEAQGIALELCLSCNVLAKMINGSFADHHLGQWLTTPNAVALSTDDVGVFDSPLSNEYLLAAKHFKLCRADVVSLAYRSVDAAFQGQRRMRALIEGFEDCHR